MATNTMRITALEAWRKARTDAKDKAVDAAIAALDVRLKKLEAPVVTPPPTEPPPTIPPPTIPPPTTPPPAGAIQVGADLQGAINSAPAGAYLSMTQDVTASSAINLSGKSGVTLDMNGHKLTTTGKHPLFIVANCTNVTIKNGEAIGATGTGVYIAGDEDAHGVEIRGGSGLVFDHLNLHHMQGDGFYVAQYGTVWANGVRISDCRVADNGRMGIAVVAGKNVLAERMTYSNIAFHVIDIEPDWNSSYAQGATDCAFLGAELTGWVGKFPSGLVDATFAYIGLPYGPVAGANQPVAARIRIEGHHVAAGITGIRTAFQCQGFRATDIIIKGNKGDQTVAGVGPNFGWCHGEGVDRISVTDNVQPMPSPGYAVYLTNSSAITASGNTGSGIVGQIKP